MRITKAPKHLKSVFKHFSHTTIFNIITKNIHKVNTINHVIGKQKNNFALVRESFPTTVEVSRQSEPSDVNYIF